MTAADLLAIASRLEAEAASLRALAAALGHGEAPIDPVEVELGAMRARCRDYGVLPIDGRWVKEAEAARLLNVSAFTMRNWRQGLRDRLPSQRIGRATCYELADLAAYKIGALSALSGAGAD